MATTQRDAQREFLTGDIDFGAPLESARLKGKPPGGTDPRTTQCPPPDTDDCEPKPDAEGVETRTTLCPPPEEEG